MEKKRALIAASVAGLMAVGVMGVTTAQAAGKVSCYGINKCKGAGDCGGKMARNACAGKNSCKGQGFVSVDSKETCLKINGGSLTPAAS